MIEPIFIECRFWGNTRDYFKGLNIELIGNGSGKIEVPHMALYGGTDTSSLKHVMSIIEGVAGRYELVSFRTGNFGYFDNPDKKWIIIKIHPSSELKTLRLQIAESLIKSKIAPPQSYDRDNNYNFHISIGRTEHIETFNHLRNIVRTWAPPDKSLHLVRISMIGKDQKIRFEYDLMLKRWLNREQALSSYWRRKTIHELRGKLGLPSEPPKQHSPIEKLLKYFRNFLCKKNIYLISDTHFDHVNIIRYCHRAFASVTEMNETMIYNWKSTVKENDIVYFLGDWAYGKGHRPISYWKRKLSGNIISIRGIDINGHPHDEYGLSHKIIKSKKHTFLLIHDPQGIKNWSGWAIHGHVHNNQSDKYPFINGHRKTINVSVEMTDYKPVSLNWLESLNLDEIKWMKTSTSTPERW
jgi:calcineurin-like phosphoesterase family protein